MSAGRSSPHLEHFLYELCWRDFFRHAARRWNKSLFHLTGPSNNKTQKRQWHRNAAAEERWKQGTTGVPLIDAAMRELLATGFMGNLARQFTAAFLVEDQGLDWRIGASWFEARIVDYDVHANWGQWARSAGVAPTNKAKQHRVGGTRYFDLALGLPGGEAARYIRAWLPELSVLPDDQIFAPWRHGAMLKYPSEPHCSLELRKYFEQAYSYKGSDRGGKGKVKGKEKGKR
jgi:deoxyribodipyrimidine photo-lyase